VAHADILSVPFGSGKAGERMKGRAIAVVMGSFPNKRTQPAAVTAAAAAAASDVLGVTDGNISVLGFPPQLI
jgi:hypothetical protein